ncbi:DUF1194 domain-containing protein [Ferrovibrio sp.]|uniref:DUF1194 domain-containing protein n=1 Tax=Ferrovibrio sp. TaxID=1917215 RepID=UPI001B484974|nr:DUF1194 domain-containing protein [Ferrovibrio sp.]MBP7063821.1 DUF1194 domain-containing protein [Ferrovibrio sp.]
MTRLYPHRRNLLAGLGATLAIGTAKANVMSAIDLALVLAVDCSGSVRGEHYDLQQRGYADAFRHRRVIEAILGGLHGGIIACYFQWSGPALHNLVIPWTVLRSRADIAGFATALQQAPRSIFGGGTAPAEAIDYGAALLQRVPAQPLRRVIDISGDGRSNRGRPPAMARDAAAAQGITINGLPILHMEEDIEEYYERNVIGGPGAFLISARDYESFADAVRRKLILEISSAG